MSLISEFVYSSSVQFGVQQRKMFMWKKANNNAIRTKIRELTTNMIEMARKGTTVNELWTIFKETLCAPHKHFPLLHFGNCW
jgi:hypothetical protein